MSTTTLPTRASSITLSLELTTLPAIREYCAIVAKTGMVPRAYQGKPDDIMVAVQMGQKLGLDFFQSLQSIATINGVPSIYGDAALSVVRSSGLLEDFDEWLEIDGSRVKEIPNLIEAAAQGKRIVQWCLSKRKGMPRERLTSYSVDDAKQAKLWLKKGREGQDTPWITNSPRMLMFRARGFNLRDNFGDVLKGMAIFEEAQDFDMTPQSDGSYAVAPAAAPAPAPAKPSLAAVLKQKAALPSTPVDVTPPPAEAAPVEAPPAEAAPVESAPVEAAPAPASLVPQIEATLQQLGKTPKGTALVNGVRKMFKLKGDRLWPEEAPQHALYLKALEGIKEKVQQDIA